jgi:hypothetical protein
VVVGSFASIVEDSWKDPSKSDEIGCAPGKSYRRHDVKKVEVENGNKVGKAYRLTQE